MTIINSNVQSDYEAFLREELQDREAAAEYLAAAIEGGSLEEFELALQTVVDVYRVEDPLAKLEQQGEKPVVLAQEIPLLVSLVSVLRSIGLTLTVKPL